MKAYFEETSEEFIFYFEDLKLQEIFQEQSFIKINILCKNISSIHKNVDHLLFQRIGKIKYDKK